MIINMIIALATGMLIACIGIWIYELMRSEKWRKNLKPGELVKVANGKKQAITGELQWISFEEGRAYVKHQGMIYPTKIKHLWKPEI